MKSRTTIALLVIVLLTAFNATIWFVPSYGFWSVGTTFSLYKAQAILAGLAALFLYARHLVVFFMVLLFIGCIVGFQNLTFLGETKVPMTFWGIYSLFWLIYFEMRRSLLGHRLRMNHPVFQFLIYALYMAATITAAALWTGYIHFGVFHVPVMPKELEQQYLALTIGIPTLTIIILKIVDMIGQQHVLYFLLGTYHRPVEKKCVVMFLDVVGSSSVAERLPPKKGMAMIADFIFDAGFACRSHGGDIVNYTGDGLVVLWPLFHADKALKAIDALNGRIEAGKLAYEKSFGITPDFRIGLHAGNVVISQIGEEKLFLGVYGDVVNTAARIEQLNKDMGTKVLLSKQVKQHVSLPYQKRIRSMGEAEVRGKEEIIEIFTFA